LIFWDAVLTVIVEVRARHVTAYLNLASGDLLKQLNVPIYLAKSQILARAVE